MGEKFSPDRGGDGAAFEMLLRKKTSEEEKKAGAMVGWAERVWKTATSHRHCAGQERPSQTDRESLMFFEHN